MDFSKEIRQRIIDFSTKACPDVLYLIHYFVSESFLESDVQVSENSNAAQDEIVAFTLNIGHPAVPNHAHLKYWCRFCYLLMRLLDCRFVANNVGPNQTPRAGVWFGPMPFLRHFSIAIFKTNMVIYNLECLLVGTLCDLAHEYIIIYTFNSFLASATKQFAKSWGGP